MRFLIVLVFLSAVALTGFGFFTKQENLQNGELFIGLGVALGFFVWMPLFLYHRWKNKNVKDYMLTKDSFKKMRDYESVNKNKKNN